MNWLKKLLTIINRQSSVNQRTQSKTEITSKKGWYNVGTFNIDRNQYDDTIPSWVKDKISDSFNKLAGEKHRYFKRKYGRKADAIALELSLENKMYNGTWFLKGEHFLYKIVFREHDESVGGSVFRRRYRG